VEKEVRTPPLSKVTERCPVEGKRRLGPGPVASGLRPLGQEGRDVVPHLGGPLEVERRHPPHQLRLQMPSLGPCCPTPGGFRY